MANVTVGWEASCACNSGGPVPCIVLDPFNGAGTTALACIQHGRQYIGTELKWDYIEITRKRIADFEEKRRNWREPKRRVLKQPRRETLFGMEVAVV